MEAQDKVRRQVKATDGEIATFVNELFNFLSRNLGKIASALNGEDLSVLEKAQAVGRIEASLQAVGLGDRISKISDVFGTELRAIRDDLAQFTKGKELFTEADSDIFASIINFESEGVFKNVELYVGDMRRVLISQALLGEEFDFSTFEDDFGNSLLNRLTTELTTATSGFNRSVTLFKCEELGIDNFLYVGPDDRVTRPFCQERVGKTYTRTEINAWDNGQGLPASIYLGGYNCRHRLVAVR